MRSVYEASKEDGAEISRLLESPVDAGPIQAIYTRRPDAYESYMKESGEPRVFVSKRENRVAATCAELIRDVYANGEVKRSAYLCGLKRDHTYQGLISTGSEFYNAIRRPDIDFYYCGVVANNTSVMKKFEKKRGIFYFRPVATYKSYILSPKLRIKTEVNPYTFRQATAADTEDIIEFLNTQGRKKDLFPYVRSFDDYHGLQVENFYLLTDEHGIKACGAIWNVSSYKQFMVKKYSWFLKPARLFNPLITLTGYPKVPKENELIDLPTISFFLSRDDSDDGYRILFNLIKNELKNHYSMFLIGLPDQHVIASVLKNKPKLAVKSVIYELRFSGQSDEPPVIDQGRIYTESATL